MDVLIFLLGIGVVWYLLSLWSVRNRLRDAEAEIVRLREYAASAADLNELSSRVSGLETHAATSPARTNPQNEPERAVVRAEAPIKSAPAEPVAAAPVPDPARPESVLPVPVMPEPVAVPEAADAQAQGPPQADAPAAPPYFPVQATEPSLSERLRGMLGDQEWEVLVGGSLLNKIGALVLVIGIALFLGYSFGHITPTGRAAMALAVSCALLGAGVRLEGPGRYRLFSRGLIGAGWAALYATSYAIYALPETQLIENPFVGSLGMLSVAVAMILHTLRYRSQAVTAVAYFVTFAALAVTPSSPFAVVSLLPLAASVLYLAWRFNWYPMALFGLAATYATCIWRGNSGAPLSATEALFCAYWILFEAFDLLRVRQRLQSDFLDLIFPVNAMCFIGLSFVTWSSHAPDRLWLASAFGAALFLSSALLRAFARPPATFEADADLVTRLRAGSYEGSFLISALLAGLAITGRVPGMWAGAGLAAEAEVIYLAGLRLKSSFLRRVGARAFALSVLQTLRSAEPDARTTVLGHPILNWTPPALFHAALFYINRSLARPNTIMSSGAVLIVAAVLAAEIPAGFVGTAWILFGLVLFEAGARRRQVEFRAQAWSLFGGGLIATAFPWPGSVQENWVPIAVSLAAFYGCAVRMRWTRRIDMPERYWFAFGMCGGTTALAAFLIWKVVAPDYAALGWSGLAVLVLELGTAGLPYEIRGWFAPLIALAASGVLLSEWDGFVKFPVSGVWLTYAGAFVASLAAAIRLTFRPGDGAAHWERSTLRNAVAALGCAAGMALAWLVVPDAYVTVAWIAMAIAVNESGIAIRISPFRAISMAMLIAIYGRIGQFDLGNAPLPAVPIAIAGIYQMWHRTRIVPLEEEPTWTARVQFWAAALPVLALIWQEAGSHGASLGWVAVAITLLEAGKRIPLDDARKQACFVAGLAFAGATQVFADPPPVWISGLTVAGFYAGHFLARRPAESRTAIYFSLLGTLLLGSVLYVQASGGLLTVSWGTEGLTLLTFGFVFRERVLRLQGLALLLVCILKLFLYDLRNLETIYRILSFVVLGLILLAVSWIYTRFREHVRRLL